MEQQEIKYFFKGYNWLSNFYPCKIIDEFGIEYYSVENYYQASKVISMDERLEFKDISPSAAKDLGQKVVLRSDWEEVKDEIMMNGLNQKFNNQELREKLINTYPVSITEGNKWHDNYWGICYCEHCKEKGIIGQNKLGKMLMRLREDIVKGRR